MAEIAVADVSVEPYTKPTGPRAYPLVGVFPSFRKDPLGFLMQCARDHGPVASWGRVMGRNWYLISSPELTQEILQTRAKKYSRGISLKYLHLLGSDNLTLSEGDAWLERRRMLQPVFGHQELQRLAALMIERLGASLGTWDRAAAENRPIAVEAEMRRLAMEISLGAFFGTRVREDSGELSDAAFTALDYINYRATNPLSLPLAFPTRRNLRFRKACKVINRIVDRIIQERRASPIEHDDLLARLMNIQGLTDEQIRCEVIEFFVAGHETTGNMLSWTWWLLMSHPEALRRIQEELDRTIGARTPVLEDIFQLDYLRMVCEESLRLHPPAYLYARSPIEDEIIGGHRIAAGSIVVLSPYILHHHPDLWENPETFDPERFNSERSRGRHRFAHIPFGGGKRVCIGQDFAMITAMVVLAMILQRYRVSAANNALLESYAGFTLRPKNELQVTPALRRPGPPASEMEKPKAKTCPFAAFFGHRPT